MDNLTTAMMEMTESFSNVTTTESPPDPDEFYYQLAEDVFNWVDPFLTIGGLVGNILTFLVMQRKNVRTSPVAIFMSALAVADSLVLLLDFINNWFKFALKIYLLGNNGFCQFHRWFFNVVYTYSAWLVAAVSVERCIVVWFPLKARDICTIRAAVIAVFVMPVVVGILYINNLWGWLINDEGQCDIHPSQDYYHTYVGAWLSSVLYSYGPLVIIITTNGCIIYQLLRARKARQSMQSSSGDGAHDKSTYKITVTVVTICVVFLVTTVPLTLWYIIIFAAGEYIDQGPRTVFIETIILIVGLSNHAVNFLLYVLSSQNFRNELCIMLRIRKPGSGRGATTSEKASKTGRSGQQMTNFTDVASSGVEKESA